MSGENNKEGTRFERFTRLMAQQVQKISPINSNIKLDEKTSGTVPRWKRIGVYLGLMKNQDDPQINGTAVILAIAFFSVLIYLVIDAGVGKLDEKDAARGEYAIAVTAGRRAEDRANKEQEKRAQIIEHFKNGGTYENLPENLKIFEQSAVDRQITKEK